MGSSAAADERFRPFVAVCPFAGLRLGEAAGVPYSDLGSLRKSLRVSRQLRRVDGGTIDVRAPTYGSKRFVYLANSLVDPLPDRLRGRSRPDSNGSTTRLPGLDWLACRAGGGLAVAVGLIVDLDGVYVGIDLLEHQAMNHPQATRMATLSTAGAGTLAMSVPSGTLSA